MPYKDPNSEEVKKKRRELAARPEAKEKKKAYQKQYYEKTKGDRIEYANSVASKRREYINKIKSAPCMDCGISYPPYVMDFDHRDPSEKIANISNMKRSYSWQVFIEEIDKCDVICSNCHRIRTYTRKDYLS